MRRRRIAGVKTFVAPLWKIADATQQALMGASIRTQHR